MSLSKEMLSSMTTVYRASWKQLAITDVLYKLLAFIILTPIVAACFRLLVQFSGRTVLADEDILFFLIEPIGLITLVVTGALTLTIVAIQQATMMQIVASEICHQRISVRTAFRDSFLRSQVILRVTARLILVTLAVIAPFAAVAGFAYSMLLTEFDINFYLQEKPPEFMVAVVIGGILLCGLTAILLWLASSWVLALPLAIFEQITPRQVLKESQRRTAGKRRQVLAWIAIWLLATTIVSSLATGLVTWIGSGLISGSSHVLWLMVLVTGLILASVSLVNAMINLFSSTTFAVLLVHLYQECGGRDLTQINWKPRAVESGIENFFQLSRTALTLMFVVAVVFAGIAGYQMLDSVSTPDHTTVTAHRGASSGAPENTLASVLLAIEEKANWVEIDVQETSDGQVVVVHDSDLKKIGGSPLKAEESTAEELRQVDIGSWFDPKYQDERVPLLSEVLAAAKGKIGVNIELKYYNKKPKQSLEAKVVAIVEEAEMASDVLIMSLKQAAVEKVHELRPDWTIGLLTAVAVGDLTRSNVDFLAVNTGLATRSFVRSAHDSGKQVFVWTVNDPAMMSTVIDRGVDSIITDKPALARSVMEQRKELSSIQRLMIQAASLLGASPPQNQSIDDV